MRLDVVRIGGENPAQVIEGLLVETVLYVDLGLLEQLADVARGSRHAHGRSDGRRRLDGRGPHQRGLHLEVVGGQLGGLLVDLLRLVAAAGVAVDARQLLEHRDRLRDLPEILEGAGEHLQRVEVAGIDLEADLQLRQSALAVALGQVIVRELLGESGVGGVEMADALDHA